MQRRPRCDAIRPLRQNRRLSAMLPVASGRSKTGFSFVTDFCAAIFTTEECPAFFHVAASLQMPVGLWEIAGGCDGPELF